VVIIIVVVVVSSISSSSSSNDAGTLSKQPICNELHNTAITVLRVRVI
jgi:hypothetical protein